MEMFPGIYRDETKSGIIIYSCLASTISKNRKWSQVLLNGYQFLLH